MDLVTNFFLCCQVKNTQVATTSAGFSGGHLTMLEEIHAALKGESSSSEAASPPPAAPPPAENSIINEHQQLLKEARSLEDLEALGFIHTPWMEVFQCGMCCKGASYSAELESQFGFFAYSASEHGLSFQEKYILPFRSLKTSLREHMGSTTHRDHLKQKADQQLLGDRLLSRNQEVGLRVGRTAYHVFKDGLSLHQFEALLLLQQRNGTDMGEINHSKMFASRLWPHMAAAIKDGVSHHLATVQVHNIETID